MPGAAHATGSELHDPVVLYHSGESCPSGIIEIELWNRDLEIWQPHPNHPRILADTCQREEAGGLLNEFRSRCWRSSDTRRVGGREEREGRGEEREGGWKIGFTLSELLDPASCPPSRALILPREPGVGIVLTSPPTDVAIQSSVATIDFEGRVELEFESIFLVHESLIADSREAIFRALNKELEGISGGLGPGRMALLGFGSRGRPQRPSVPRLASPTRSESTSHGREVSLDLGDSLPDLRVRLNRIVNGAVTADRVADFSAALNASEALLRSSARLGARRSVVALIDGDAPLPLGEEIGGRPVERERIVAAIDALHEAGVHVHLLVRVSSVAGPSEFLGRVRSRFVGSPAEGAVEIFGSSDAVSARVAALRPPRLIGLEAVDARNETSVDELRYVAGGAFRFRQRLDPGVNPLRLVARLSDGRVIAEVFEPVFDDTLVRERLLEIERARMRKIRARRGVVTLEVEPE